MEPLKSIAPNQKFVILAFISSIVYFLGFLIFGSRLGPAVASFSTIPVLFTGWALGPWAGLIAGAVSLPIHTFLFNQIGFPGIDVVFRVGGGPGTYMLVLMGGAAGLVRQLYEQLNRQIKAFQISRASLQTSEKNYRDLFEGVPIGIYRTTPEGQILSANAAMVDLFGYSDVAELCATPITQLFLDSADRETWQSLIEREGVVRNFDIQLQKKDGTKIWVEDNARMVRDPAGICLYYEGSLIDISSRKNAEALLRESETRYRELLDNLPQRVYYKDCELAYVKINPAYARDVNLPVDEVAGKNDFDLYPPDLAEKYQVDDRQVMAQGNSIEIDTEYVLDGDRRVVHSLKAPVRDQNGRIRGILGIFWDLTASERTERALLTSQAQLANAVTIAHLGPWEYDVATNQFIFNDYFYALFGTTAAREGGYLLTPADYVRRFVHPDDAEMVGEEIRKMMETTDPTYSRELEHRILYADGMKGFINVRFSIVKDELGRTIKALGANQDISERKRLDVIRETLLAENRRQNELLGRIIQETPAGIAFLDGSEYRYTLVNPGYLEFVHGKGNILNRTVAQVWPEAIEALKPLLDHVYKTGEAFHAVDMPFTMIRDRGPETAYFTFTYTPMIGEKGNVESLLVTAQETTEQIQVRRLLENELAERKKVEAELRESEQRYEGIFEDSPVTLWQEDFSAVKQYIEELILREEKDLSKYLDEHPEVVRECILRVRVADVNQQALTMYHAESKEMLLANFESIFLPESYAIFKQELLAIAQGQRVFESEGRNGTLTGEILDIHLRWSIAPGFEESLSRVFVSILDITHRKKAEALAQKQAAQAEALSVIANALSAVSLNAEAIYEIITRNTAALIGDACLLTLFHKISEQVSIAAFHHTDPERTKQMQEILPSELIPLSEGVRNQIAWTGKPIIIPKLHKDEVDQIQEPGYREYLANFGGSSIIVVPINAQGDVIGTLGVISDIHGSSYSLEDLSLLRYLANQASLPILNAQLYEQIKQQALLDPLTGVPNRRHFFESAEMEFQRAQRYGHNLAVIMLDIDHFKEVNDTFGHDVGDQMLISIADQCRACVRSTDLVGRYGGDEFLILLPETDLEGAYRTAERIRWSIENRTSQGEDKQVEITVSLGVAEISASTRDLVHLLRSADEAMYAAKQAGRNQIKTHDTASF